MSEATTETTTTVSAQEQQATAPANQSGQQAATAVTTETEQTTTKKVGADETDWKAEARKWEARAKENGGRASAAEESKSQVETERQQLLDGIAKALGIKPEDTPPDPAELQKSLADRESRVTGLQQDLQDASKELAAWRVAARQGVNAVALMDSRSFLSEVKKLDPTADDFSVKLEAAVKTAVDGNPALRGTVTPGQAGIGTIGGSGTSIADASARDLLRSAYSSTQ